MRKIKLGNQNREENHDKNKTLEETMNTRRHLTFWGGGRGQWEYIATI